jgi:hypothetical protein
MTRARSLSQLANSNVFSVDANNSRVGIGSTIPDVKLDVGGDLYADNLTINNLIGVAATFSGVVTYEDVTNVDSVGIITARSDISIADKIIHTGDTNTAIRFPANDTFTVETAGSEALRVNSTQRVEIGGGGAAIDSRLHVTEPTASGRTNVLTLETRGTSEDDGPAINFISDSGSTVNGSIVGAKSQDSGSDAYLAFYTYSSSTLSERLRITSGGNVGVGSDSPDASLVVDSGTTPTTIKITSNTESSIDFNDKGGSPKRYKIGTNISSNDGQFEIKDMTANAERLRIDSSGRMLVGRNTNFTGTNAQYGLLQISGNSAGSAGDGRIVIGRGEVPTAANQSLGQINFVDNTAGEFASIKVFTDAACGTNDYPGRIEFHTTSDGSSSPTERLRIDSKGNFIFKNGALIENGFYDNGGGITGDYTHDLATYGNVHYAATDAAGAFTYNVRVDSSTTLNSVMSTGDVCSITLISSNGNTARYMTAFKVDGTTQTVEWAGASAPSAATGSGWDIYSFTIVKTGDATFKVFASFTNHG